MPTQLKTRTNGSKIANQRQSVRQDRPLPVDSATQAIITTRFGTIRLRKDQVYHFENGLPGFENATRFALIPHCRVSSVSGSPFVWLQCCDEPALALPLISPWLTDPEYAPKISGVALRELGITDIGRQAVIYCVVTLPPGNPDHATVNLLAPVLLNRETKCGRQIICQTEIYSMTTPLRMASTANAE